MNRRIFPGSLVPSVSTPPRYVNPVWMQNSDSLRYVFRSESTGDKKILSGATDEFPGSIPIQDDTGAAWLTGNKTVE